MGIAVGTRIVTRFYSVLDDLRLPIYIGAGRDKISVSLFTKLPEARLALCVGISKQKTRQSGSS
jgi:hypothetical protein